jgi:hypothetical protein
MVFAWVICGATIYVIQWMNLKAAINRSGVLFDVIGLYWLFRQKLRSWTDVKFAFKLFAWCALILMPFIVFEWSTGRNPFVILGRVITDVRYERYRCQGAFPHAIMLGLYWATLVPVFIGLAATEGTKYLYWGAAGASIFIVCGTASTTPLVVLAGVILLLLLFRYRIYGRQMFYYFCAMVAALHIAMKAPVWHLIARVNIVGGSTGWHRFNLIDEAIKHFSEWAILGTRSTAHWGWGLWDITNQYVLEAVRGGLITLILFIVLLVKAVETVGRYSLNSTTVDRRWLGWCLCVSIIGHCVSFMGVSYFGQIMMLLYLMFAVSGLIYEMSLQQIPVKSLFVPAVQV